MLHILNRLLSSCLTRGPLKVCKTFVLASLGLDPRASQGLPDPRIKSEGDKSALNRLFSSCLTRGPLKTLGSRLGSSGGKKPALIAFLFFALLAQPAFADTQKIAAVVNDDAITLREFQARKKMIVFFNHIGALSQEQEKILSKTVIEGLIEEQLLFQQGKKFKINISDNELSKAIADIEQRNKMSPGQMSSNLRAQGVDFATFKSKIKSELLKSRLVSDMLARNITVSPREVDAAVLDSNSKDVSLTLKILIADDNSQKSYNKMVALSKKLPECSKIKPKTYAGFAHLIDLDSKLSNLEPQLQTIVKDIAVGYHSDVVEVNGDLKILAVCSKKIENFTEDETIYVINFLGNKKLSLKMRKYTDDLRKKAYVKILM
jgi:parvulin-like peptidyl-prolyl isomerase